MAVHKSRTSFSENFKLKRKRTDFTKKQKAEIFSRDRGTCAFSGISVWLFDYGIRPNYEIDWADHIVPSAKGGTSVLSNGICASSFYNAKKKDNGSDNKFLFKNGRVTETFVKVHGAASNIQIADLKRRKPLMAIDWYVNRAISNTYFAFDWRCELEFNSKKYKRDDEYYYKVAFNMLKQKIKDSHYKSIESRKMISADRPFGVGSLLQIEGVESAEQYREWAESLWPEYRSNWNLYNTFLRSICTYQKREILLSYSGSKDVNPALIQGLFQLMDEDFEQKLQAA